MRNFYTTANRFESLHNTISNILSGKLDSKISEGWLEDFYVTNKYATTKSIEKYTAEVLMDKIENSDIPKDHVVKIMDDRLDEDFEPEIAEEMTDITLSDKLYMLDAIRNIPLTEEMLVDIVNDFELSETIRYIKENVYEYLSHSTEVEDDVMKQLEMLKYSVRMDQDVEELKESLKDVYDNNEYINNEIECLREAIEYKQEHDKLMNDVENNYERSIDVFNNMVESVIIESEEIDIEKLYDLVMLTEALCDYEETLEASSRIITKGTEKVTKAIGNRSAKSGGMSASDSKIGQIKRGARVIDDRASGAINKKLDDIINFTQEQKREEILTGRNTVKLSKCLKTVITLMVGAQGVKLAGKLAGKSVASKLGGGVVGKMAGAAASPLTTLAITIIGLLVAHALSKRTKEREKKRIMLELQTELKIVKEKIEDAKGENKKQEKYELMRIESQLEKEILRIQHGLRYY